MPNGESRNWIRFLMTLEGFYAVYGKWPTENRLYRFFIRELQGKLSIEDFRRLQSKIKLVPDEENPFLSIDEERNTFDYARGGMPHRDPSINAIGWLEITEPDYFD